MTFPLLASDLLSRTLLVFCFRALPISIYALCCRTASFKSRLLVMLAFAGALLGLDGAARTILGQCIVGLGYYAGASCFIHVIASNRTKAIAGFDAFLVFLLSGALFVAVPATALRTISTGTFLILGWELALKAYSYLIERSSRGARLQDALFFFLVDPTIVHPMRAKPISHCPTSQRAVSLWGRVLLGTVCIALSFAVLSPAVSAIAAIDHSGLPGLGAAFFGYGAARFLELYAQHSGVAHIQLGLLRLLGHNARERYDNPLRATSPIDLWSRWNTYVTEWAKRYIYLPITLRALRLSDGSGAWLTAVTVLVSFTAMGVLHDLYTLASQGFVGVNSTAFFAGNALLIVVWQWWVGTRPGVASRALAGAQTAAARIRDRFVLAAAFAAIVAATS